ncbi:MAG: BMP family protein [Caldilineaceae bacterium]|nr:BMP family protein [Caldilineaceae bacterium]
MKRIGMLLVVALLLAACVAPAAPAAAPAEGETTAAPAEESAAGGEPFRVAIVMPSSTEDIAWSQSMYSALVAVQTEMGGESAMEISVSENMFQVADAAAAIRDYAADGNDLVIAHGTQYGNSMFEVAKDFPETSFAWGTATDTGEADGFTNVFAYEAKAQEGGYVNGVIAAMLSKAGIIGVVGPVEAGDAKLYIDGFVAGVKATNPDAEVTISYTGSFGDTALAAEAANTHIKAGADVLTGSAQQVVGAIGVAAENGVFWLGTQADQTPLAPDYVVANQLYNWIDVVKDMIALHNAGTLGGKAYTLTLSDGLDMQLNDNPALTDEIRAAADAAIAGIKAGEIDPMPAAE